MYLSEPTNLFGDFNQILCLARKAHICCKYFFLKSYKSRWFQTDWRLTKLVKGCCICLVPDWGSGVAQNGHRRFSGRKVKKGLHAYSKKILTDITACQDFMLYLMSFRQ